MDPLQEWDSRDHEIEMRSLLVERARPIVVSLTILLNAISLILKSGPRLPLNKNVHVGDGGSLFVNH